MDENTVGYGNEGGVTEALERVADAVLTGALVDAVASGNGQLVTLVIDALRRDEVGIGRALKALDAEWIRFD